MSLPSSAPPSRRGLRTRTPCTRTPCTRTQGARTQGARTQGALATRIATVAVALVLGAAAAGCATDTTASSQAPGPGGTASAAQAHNSADVTFAQSMIPHHQQAIAMARMAAQRAVSPQLKSLAATIPAMQQPEIDQLTGFLRAWNAPTPGHRSMPGMSEPDDMPGMMSDAQMSRLGQASGPAFDRMFLQMMIGHHQGAVTMAKTELREGQNPETKALARRIITTQQHEIAAMRTMLPL